MANIKSAKKRIKVTETKTARNKAIKSRVKTETKKVLAAVESGDKTTAEKQLLVAISYIDRAKVKGIYHKKTAARKVSRLTKAVNNA
ncbi:30S ribosomal protein S20 [Vallitalea guaymasensis]|uniref:Small ribosomal subunit protein bS20 n=1 Tax=Vallitalea guaymasensis TaxID=1185412 RepID=A0A8J8MDN4_9FIRM|nr:30S ribosomal protein S20 [Vallitalea guaymasensis]QUH30996.1 30S ribosomal protein S20 [Vallitalea guaymasensis]